MDSIFSVEGQLVFSFLGTSDFLSTVFRWRGVEEPISIPKPKMSRDRNLSGKKEMLGSGTNETINVTFSKLSLVSLVDCQKLFYKIV
jgi:hypothetical protein